MKSGSAVDRKAGPGLAFKIQNSLALEAHTRAMEGMDALSGALECL
jgi:hypothetical protein